MPSSPASERRRLPSLTGGRRILTPHQVATCLVLELAFGFYLWTAGTSAQISFGHSDTDVYNLLTTALLHGHTFLPLHVPAGLLHAGNPYDPAQNGPYNMGLIHDLAFRGGRLYSPWGPTPVFTLFMPFRLTGLRMSQTLAVVLFAFVGLVCAVKLMHVLVRRFVPAAPNWLLTAATVALALTNVVPFMLRRPAQYEVAISCGYCFEMAGLLLVAMAVLAEPARIRRLAWGSLCLGLAMGARLSLAAGGLVAVAAAVHLIRHRGAGRRVVIAALGPIAACLLLLGLYNAVRFGSFGNFGEKYQLAGLDQFTMPVDQLSYLPPGLFSYLLMPARFAFTFPHVFLQTTALYPGSFPFNYAGSPGGWPAEPAGGLFPTMPLTLLLALVPWRWRRAPAERQALAVAGGLAVLGLAIMVLLALALWGTTQRYEVDYASLFLIAATILWALLVVSLRGRRALRRVAAGVGVALAAFGALVGVAVSFSGYYPVLRTGYPGVWSTLQDVTSPFAAVAAKLAGRAVIAEVDSPFPVDLPHQNLATTDDGGAGTWLGGGPVEVDVVAPAADRLKLHALALLGPGVTLAQAPRVRVISAGGAVSTTPVTDLHIGMPIRLSIGLNRLRIELEGPGITGIAAEKVYLGSMSLGR